MDRLLPSDPWDRLLLLARLLPLDPSVRLLPLARLDQSHPWDPLHLSVRWDRSFRVVR